MMASVSLVARRQLFSRGFRTAAALRAAQAMTMPAMSPTMTEGGISSWKVKEGQEFSTGDVLLEIETDKAQMDVEAMDDGVMAKILVPTGSKNVAIGTRIAILAEVGDDLSTLELPKVEAAAREETKEVIEPGQSKKAVSVSKEKPKEEKVETSVESTPDQHASRPFHPSPSVMNLLRANSIDTETSTKIPGSGPRGRLLKGDILAYLGQIDKSVPKSLGERITKLGKMDLSNVKIAPPKPKAEKASEAKKAAAPPKMAAVALPVDFSRVYKTAQEHHIPLSQLISRATAAANAALPAPSTPPTVDELFNDILGLPNAPRRTTKGSYEPTITPVPVKGRAATEVGREEEDIFDVLVGAPGGVVNKNKAAGPRAGMLASGENLLTLKVPAAEEARAKVFLGRVKEALERQ